MDEVEVSCPVCGEANYISAEEYDTLAEGDVMDCPSCGATLEVVSIEPLELLVVEGDLHEFYVDCPRCETQIAISADEEGEPVTCENCGFTFVPDWSEVHEDEEEPEYLN